MRIFADRFLLDAPDTIDLATGEAVRLSIVSSPRHGEALSRAMLCDLVAPLRHPLLVSLVDYGAAEGTWFEARAAATALRGSPPQIRRAAFHVVRFLRANGVEPTRELTAAAIRPAVEAVTGSWRPIGHRLVSPDYVDPVRTLLEDHRAGFRPFTIAGRVGSGLRTARLIVARCARLAGFVPLARRFVPAVVSAAPRRHYCVLDWMPDTGGADVPLLRAAAASGRRPVWLRFVRGENAPARIGLGNIAMSELMKMVYVDPEFGPAPGELAAAARSSDGLPGRFIDLLARDGRRDQATSVHETAPAYVVRLVAQPQPAPPHAGVQRVRRLLAAAPALAASGRHRRAERLLRLAGPALAARGAFDDAAEAVRLLAALCTSRGRAREAIRLLEQAREWRLTGRSVDALLLETARARLELLEMPAAEAACRAVLAGEGRSDDRDRAEVMLAVALTDAAPLVLDPGLTERSADAAALAARSSWQAGDLARASSYAHHALRACGPAEHPVRTQAYLALMRVAADTTDLDGARRYAGEAIAAARASRMPGLRLVAEAACAAVFDPTGGQRAARLRRVARACSPLCEREVMRQLSGARSPRHDPVGTLERLIAMVFDAPDEPSALAHVSEWLLRDLGASTVAILGSRRQPLAVAGRPWSGAAALADLVITGGAPAIRDGVMREAGEPVRAGGSTIGSITVRWPPGSGSHHRPELLRLAAAAAVPAVTLLNAPAPVLSQGASPDDLLGSGPAADRVRELVRRAATAPYPVLIEGESGSGKELVARAIHARGARRARKFCAVNCAALTDDLLEAELFGHARGAFTGAIVERAGLFEEADQGTLFLDEVAELSPRAQAKLLRVLQEGEVRRVGETLARRVDVRVVSATNRPLAGEVDAGRFRADLRFRLDVLRIPIPALRERADEVVGLAERIWAEAANRVGTRAALAPDFLAALARYDWPGNVRELQNVLAAVAVHSPRRGRVHASDLPPHVARLAGRQPGTFEEARLDFEQRFVRAALARAGGRRGLAARQLGLSRQGLAKMMKRLGIS